MAENTTTATETTTDNIDYKAEFEKMQAEYSKLKTSFDKASSDVADYKRKERERMTDDEKRKSEDEEREKYYKELERRIALADYASALDDVTDAKVKGEIAELFADGKIAEAMAKHKEYRVKDRAELAKQIKADLMKQNPQATAGSGKPAKTKDEIMAIKDAEERQKAIAENIALFQ